MFRTSLVFAALVACSGDTPTDKDDTDTDGSVDTDTDTDIDTDDCEGVVDDCGVCDGGDADKDCDGVCFGDAVEDACGTCDTDGTNDCQTAVTLVGGGWDCANNGSCQDVFDVVLAAGAEVALTVDNVSGDSVIRLAVFAPGQPLASKNLLVGTRKDLACTGQDETATAAFTAGSAGTYKVAIGRDWNESLGESGTYEATIASPQGLPAGVVAAGDDVPSEALGARCGSEYELTGGWNCASIDSCQDAYTLDVDAGTELRIAVSDLLGDSVTRHALYAPGVALGGTNELTGDTNDLMCNTDQNAIITLPPRTLATTGTYTYALTRDWGESGGQSGAYVLNISADTFFDQPMQTVDDVASLAPGGSCPGF